MAKPVTAYIAHWKTRTEKQDRSNPALRNRARTEARELAKVLAGVYGAQKVYLFGSLARDDASFTATSDIDLGVEGLPDARFYQALGDLLLRSSFLVDLKPMSDVSDSLRSCIMEEGILLYG